MTARLIDGKAAALALRERIAGEVARFREGSSVHTENSHKYGLRGGRMLLLAGGWTPVIEWTDEEGDFALVLAEAQPTRFAP